MGYKLTYKQVEILITSYNMHNHVKMTTYGYSLYNMDNYCE